METIEFIYKGDRESSQKKIPGNMSHKLVMAVIKKNRQSYLI